MYAARNNCPCKQGNCNICTRCQRTRLEDQKRRLNAKPKFGHNKKGKDKDAVPASSCGCVLVRQPTVEADSTSTSKEDYAMDVDPCDPVTTATTQTQKNEDKATPMDQSDFDS